MGADPQRQDGARRLVAVLGDTRDARLRTLGLFAFFFLVIAAFWLQKPIRTSRFLSRVGPESLPYVKLGTALLLLPIVLLYSSLVARYRRASIVYVCVAVFAACTVVFWWLLSRGGEQGWTPWAYFFYVDIFNSVMVALFWSFANDVTSPDDARRTYGFVGAGGILGGAVGSGLTGWTVERLGAPNLLFVCLVVLGGIAVIAYLLSAATGDSPGPGQERPQPSWREAVAGARLTLASPYLMAIALLVVSYEIVSNVIDFQFSTMVAELYADEAAMTAFLGRFNAGAIIAALVAQFVLTTWILRTWGPRVGLLVLPVVLGLGSGALVAVPLFAVVAATFFSDAALSYSLNQSTKEVLYTPTGQAEKYQAKAFIDMFLMRLAKAGSSLLILACITWWLPGLAAVHQLGLVSIAVVVVWVVVAHVAGRGFDARTEARAPVADAACAPGPLPNASR
jgi:AAA family ATP:ADP antiporter